MNQCGKICIVGAGASGLCAARNVLTRICSDLVVYESTDKVGGVWSSGDGKSKAHPSMYESLRTNLPKEAMGFPDFPFSTEGPSFVHRSIVEAYLRSYADKHGLKHFIKFNTEVVNMRRSSVKSSSPWTVEARDTLTNLLSLETFDAIFVCNGHYSEPEVPQIDGVDCFSGTFIHSKDYRTPECFTGKRVVCIGAHASGIDIAVEVASVACKVYLAHRLPFEVNVNAEFPDNLTEETAVVKFLRSGVIFADGSQAEVDAVIYCTGYVYRFPFLENSNVDIRIENSRVRPLFQHLVHIEEPTLFFIGLPYLILPFPVFDVQVKFCLSVLTGRCRLPSREVMNDWEENNILRRRQILGPTHKQGHLFGPLQWPYIDELAALGGFKQPVSQIAHRIYDKAHSARPGRWTIYKNDQYHIRDNGDFYVDYAKLPFRWSAKINKILRKIARHVRNMRRLIASPRFLGSKPSSVT